MNTGNHIAPTPPAGDSSNRVATTEFVTQAIGITITADTTVWVSGSTGSDSTGDGSSGNPYQTWNHAIGIINRWNLNGHTVTIKSTSAQTYTTGINMSINGLLMGLTDAIGNGSTVVLDGNGSTVNDSANPDQAGVISVYAPSDVFNVIVQNFTLNQTGANCTSCLDVFGDANMTVGAGITFGTAANFAHITIGDRVFVSFEANYSVTNGAVNHLYIGDYAQASYDGITITGSSGLNFGAFWNIDNHCELFADSLANGGVGFSGFSGVTGGFVGSAKLAFGSMIGQSGAGNNPWNQTITAGQNAVIDT